ncbi:gliding motility lipoprotein GldD [Tenacibaculum maritimum]|uniref:Gliding motility lipoprotein GldD n=1 Tax=Tenacibaculum maritimum NCIMB 2154 TaxID=1349785 RepID=A0A2H1E5T7_9FLAO|nr:gliding motility lipoprotein GldD [Tenacibaculum maritimum]SFZ80039.1 Gliding motility lipoprotein precursor GldD [Tenacibaculum maritimum NCIMB 2154]
MRSLFIVILSLILITSCKNEVIPKPKGYLSLNYPQKAYHELTLERPYSFEVPQNTIIKKLPKDWLKVIYPNLKASIDITYRPVDNNLRELLIEAEKLVFEHAIKAEQIASNDFVNKNTRVFGKMYDITGNSASQVQFHVTDSTKHFLKGSLFFYSKPNYDSVLPAVDYIKKDMIRMIESLQWK